MDASAEPDYYAVLSLETSASTAEIKAAYHRALLLHHPDKQLAPDRREDALDLDTLKRAFVTLSTTELRTKYDTARSKPRPGPRPAQVVSLEEFTVHEDENLDDIIWSYDCRCGGAYRITEQDMEKDQHLIGCNSCSEVVWAGYEMVDDDERDEA
ncbi:DnaJ and zf-CSL domain-containing protein [Phanerochaete sordida]|uniref:Diphthamide biosynthesis protein 4 n=1 Tax=Phanerochaete sordida TaxID=48140 RepID=A0A9P3LBR3_9APHY|nr:DnaJ and zf-CSL domain-containing protein [Phanerochaete sordida]